MAYTTSNNCNKNKETKENKTTKRLRLTKTKLKDMLKYEQKKRNNYKELVKWKKNHQTCDEDHKFYEKMISL